MPVLSKVTAMFFRPGQSELFFGQTSNLGSHHTKPRVVPARVQLEQAHMRRKQAGPSTAYNSYQCKSTEARSPVPLLSRLRTLISVLSLYLVLEYKPPTPICGSDTPSRLDAKR